MLNVVLQFVIMLPIVYSGIGLSVIVQSVNCLSVVSSTASLVVLI